MEDKANRIAIARIDAIQRGCYKGDHLRLFFELGRMDICLAPY